MIPPMSEGIYGPSEEWSSHLQSKPTEGGQVGEPIHPKLGDALK